MGKRWRASAAILLAFALVLPAAGWAVLLAPSPPEANARLAALEAVPHAHQPAVRALLEAKPLHIRIRPSPFRTTTRIYDYLLARLPLAATLSRALSLGLYIIEPIGPRSFRATDQQGLEGTIIELAAADGHRVYLGRGRYDGRWIHGVTGRAIIVLRYEPVALDYDRSHVTNTIDCLVRLDDVILHTMARLLGSLLQGLMEGKLNRAIKTAEGLSERLAVDPQAVYQSIARTPDITPTERAEFTRWFLKP